MICLTGRFAAKLSQLRHVQSPSFSLGRPPDILGKHVSLAIHLPAQTANEKVARVLEAAGEMFLHPSRAEVAPSADILMDQVQSAILIVPGLVKTLNAVYDRPPANGPQIDEFLEIASRDDTPQAIRRCVAIQGDGEVLGKEFREAFRRPPLAMCAGPADRPGGITGKRYLNGLRIPEGRGAEI